MITGSGVIYTVIASIENTSYQAAYVPSLTYSCSIMFYDNSCDVLRELLNILKVKTDTFYPENTSAIQYIFYNYLNYFEYGS